MYDLLIKNGTIFNGTGSPSFYGDIGVKDGRIARIGKGLEGAKTVIDATGLTVTPGFIDSHSHGDLVSRIIADVDTFAEGLLMGFTQLFTGIMTILGTLVLMLVINWKIALVVLLITPLSLVVASFIAKRTYSMFRVQTATRGRQTALIDETIGNIKVVRAFGHEAASLEQFDEILSGKQKNSADTDCG